MARVADEAPRCLPLIAACVSNMPPTARPGKPVALKLDCSCRVCGRQGVVCGGQTAVQTEPSHPAVCDGGGSVMRGKCVLTQGVCVGCQRAVKQCVQCVHTSPHVRGAPPIVASGRRSMLYLCWEMYMMGTPGICSVQQQQGCSSTTREQGKLPMKWQHSTAVMADTEIIVSQLKGSKALCMFKHSSIHTTPTPVDRNSTWLSDCSPFAITVGGILASQPLARMLSSLPQA